MIAFFALLVFLGTPRPRKWYQRQARNAPRSRSPPPRTKGKSAASVRPALIGSNDERRSLALLNAFRKENGKPPLKASQLLLGIARQHSQAMSDGKVPFGHSGFDKRAKKVPHVLGVAENVVYSMGHPDAVKNLMQGWINSPGHRANMLGDYTAVGIGLMHRGSTWYGTQFFAKMPGSGTIK
jgi:uncharacterized protein YkwD